MKRIVALLVLLCAVPAFLYAKEYKVVTFTTEMAGTVTFNHEPHLERLGHNCTYCHNKIFSLVKKNPHVTMAEMAKGKSCGTCHNKERAFGLSECTRCHNAGEVQIKIPKFGTVVFSHSFHLSMFTCTDCHTKIFRPSEDNPHVTMAQMEKGRACGACHDGSTAFSVKGDCTKCHKVKDISFAADALFSHKIHLTMFSCRDCHTKIFIAGPGSIRYTMQEMQKGKSCGTCHDGSTAFSVKGDCGKCHNRVEEITFKPTDAHFSHKIHTAMFKCTDCHSGIFIGGVASKRYTMADMQKGKSCGACHDGSTAFSVKGDCDKCHKSTKDVTFTIPNAGKVTFSHQFHTGMFKCGDCHNAIFQAGSQSKRFTMAQMQKGAACGACHDGKTAFSVSGSCGKCHPVKDITFIDDARFSHNKHLEMFSCTDCHNKLFVAGPDNKRRTMADMAKGLSCGSCHDGSTAFSVKGDCDKCHRTTIEISLRVPEAGVTVFSHKFHTAMFKCGDCHNGIFTAGQEAKRYKMADMEKGEACGACHDGKTAFSVKDSCTRCHPVREISFKGSGAFFSHKFHIEAFRCSDCHDRIFSPGYTKQRFTMPEMEQGKACGACHDGNTAFSVKGSCAKCHPVTQAIKFEVPGSTGNVIFSHKVHLSRGYNCTDCHNKVIAAGVMRRVVTMKEMGEGKSCGACHGFSMAFSVKDPNSCQRCHLQNLFGDKWQR